MRIRRADGSREHAVEGTAAPGAARPLIARLGGFVTTSTITGVVSVLVVPLLVRGAGVTAWGGVAVGQAIGVIAAIVVGLGWGVSGAATVASDPGSASTYLRESLVTRAVIAPPLALAAAFAAAAAAPAAKPAAALTAVAFCMLGFSSNWFFIGSGRPRSLLALETAPRAAGTLLGALLVLAGLPLLLYPLLVLGGSLTGVTLTARFAATGRLRRPVMVTVSETLRTQRHAAVAGIVSASYINLPTVAVALLAPSQTPLIALADRLFAFANAGLAPVNQTMQSWIPHPDAFERRVRIHRGTRIIAGVAAAAVLGYALLAVPIGLLLSTGRIGLGWPIVLCYAATLGFTTLSQTVGVACLTSLGAVRSVARSAIAGAVIGVALLIPATTLLGATGAALAETAAEGIVIGVQVLALRRRLAQPDA